MAKSPNQKLKLLYLRQILLEKTDENHTMTVAEMIAELESHGISAERKSIYDDLEALRTFGVDVNPRREKKGTGYYVGARRFELPELKLLVDSVQSSRFITSKKTDALIRKVESLASTHEAQTLHRQVYVLNRVKSMNESAYYNVDAISNAITQDQEISFRYSEYTLTKELRFRKNGALYHVSPYALLWDDDRYYMLGWDDSAGIIKHYRVDRMSNISLSGEARKGKAAFEAVDMSAYTRKVFGMFTGAEEKVTLRFANHLVGAVIDRFGKDVPILPADGDSFTFTVEVEISPQFFAWVYAYGAEAEIVSPPAVREQMRQRLRETAALYSE